MKLFVSACTLAIVAFAPLAGPAADKMASPKPAMMSGMKMTHQCRDAKGHFVKGKYMKCPAGTHKAM